MDDGHRTDADGATRTVEDAFVRLFRSGRTNAILAWAMVGVLALVLVESALDGDVQWIAFVAAVGVLVGLPAVANRDWRIMLPWELLVLALLPILVRGVFGGEIGIFAMYLSVAALALIAVVELHRFTDLTVTHWFAVALVVLTTMAAVAAWSVVRWNFDRVLGTSYLSSNEALMAEFGWVTLAGFAAGLLFDAYFRRRESVLRRLLARVVGRTLLYRPAVGNQLLVTIGMQLVLAGMVVYGIVAGQPKAISNGSVALAITFLPAILERDYALQLDPWLGLWITAAVFLHTLGSAGLYGGIGWWDHLTHATSASLVAAVGYTAARAVDLHSDEIEIPRRFAFAYIFVVVLAFGVIWELFEFALDVVAMESGYAMPLAQHGLDDTVRDLMFNSLGALVVAAFGQAYLHGTAHAVGDRFLTRD